MHEYGTTSRQFGAVAVACRKHASLNAAAQMRKPITLEDHQNSPIIADPFRLLDCSLFSDGAAAMIVTSAERARDCPQPPVYIRGMGYSCEHVDVVASRSMTNTAARGASRRLQDGGDYTRNVDVAELYDCFTSVVLVTLEDYGFCKKGESGAFVEGARVELGGSLPVNTHRATSFACAYRRHQPHRRSGDSAPPQGGFAPSERRENRRRERSVR